MPLLHGVGTRFIVWHGVKKYITGYSCGILSVAIIKKRAPSVFYRSVKSSEGRFIAACGAKHGFYRLVFAGRIKLINCNAVGSSIYHYMIFAGIFFCGMCRCYGK